MNTKAATSVASQLEVVLATEAGTETSGILAISGEEYFSLVSFFIQSLETNMAGASILTLSHSLSNVVTTLTQDQVTTLTEMQTRLTSVQTQLESFTTNLKEEFESLTGAAATENQILSGSTVDEDKDHASKTYLMALQSLMVTRQTIMQVENILTVLSSEGGLSNGEEVSGDEFFNRLFTFFMKFEEDITSTTITTLLVTLTRVTVTLNEEQKTSIVSFQDQLEIFSQRLEIAMSFYKEQFEMFTGVAGTETQMQTGDPFASLSFMSASKIVKLETLHKNKHFVEKVRMSCEAIAEDALTGTSSGMTEMTLEELNKLVMEFFNLVSQDFLSSTSTGPGSTIANDLVIKIQSAKLTFALNETEIKMVEFIVERLVNLEKDFAGVIQVYFFQYSIITGNSLEIQVNEVPCQGPSMMMTTKSSSMMTTKSHAMMTTRPTMTGSSSMMSSGSTMMTTRPT